MGDKTVIHQLNFMLPYNERGYKNVQFCLIK